jgi:hypothetical protein
MEGEGRLMKCWKVKELVGDWRKNIEDWRVVTVSEVESDVRLPL